MTRLKKGQNIVLTASTVRVVVSWQPGLDVPDVDVSVLLLGQNYKVSGDADFIFYNQPTHPSGSVRYEGKGAERGKQVDAVFVDTRKVPSDVHRVLIGASADGGSFEKVPKLELRFLDGASGAELASFELTDASTETAFQMGEVYRRGGQWKLRAIGQGYDSGLRGFATDFGVSVEDEEPQEPPAPVPPSRPARPPVARSVPGQSPTTVVDEDVEPEWEPPPPWDPDAGLAVWAPTDASGAPRETPGRPTAPTAPRHAANPPAASPPRAPSAPPTSSTPRTPSTPAAPSSPPAAPSYTLPQIDPNPQYAPPPAAPTESGHDQLPPSAPGSPFAPRYEPPSTSYQAPPVGSYQPSVAPYQPPAAPPTGSMPVAHGSAAPTTTGAMPVRPTTTGPVNLAKQRKLIDMEKRVAAQAPRLLSLTKQAAVSLEKRGLGSHTARVALCLDISASMSGLYRSGKIQALVERVLALGLRFDDNEQVDVFLFGANAHEVGELGIHNFAAFLSGVLRQYPLEGGTMYGAAMRLVRRQYFGSDGMRQQPAVAHQPVYVMFVTDGATFDRSVTEQQLRASSLEPIFWQFMAIGDSSKAVDAHGRPQRPRGFLGRLLQSDFSFLESLDTLSNRFLDNANFFAVTDPANISDEVLFELMMTEYPGWLVQARRAGMLPPG